MEQREQIGIAIAQMIRDRSEAGQLIQFEEISAQLNGQGLLNSEFADETSDPKSVLGRVLASHDDIREIHTSKGIPCYYSMRSLSGTYAGILVRKGENPLPLLAHVVRENSRLYPRPVSLDIFRESPFDLTREEVEDCLERMREQREYQDVAQTTTSIGTVFLYSREHLDPDYASMLAEWSDVGQANNP